MTLTEFLLARIAEDAAAAGAAIDPDRPGTHWAWFAPDDNADPDAPRWLRSTEEFPTVSGVGPLPAFPLGFEFLAEPSTAMAHIARHDPARVLAECAAKRRIVRRAQAAESALREPDLDDGTYFIRRSCRDSWVLALGDLALPYADHPDYREEWRS